MSVSCCKYQLFKEWKQITTWSRWYYSKTELLQISVVQRMKANHNSQRIWQRPNLVVANMVLRTLMSCCKYQLFKEWKQITTSRPERNYGQRLLQISVVQRMKANHNRTVVLVVMDPVVANISCSKNESKSQHNGPGPGAVNVVANISCSKNESKSQLL